MQFVLTYSTYNRCSCHSRQCVTVIEITSANLHCLQGRTNENKTKQKKYSIRLIIQPTINIHVVIFKEVVENVPYFPKLVKSIFCCVTYLFQS